MSCPSGRAGGRSGLDCDWPGSQHGEEEAAPRCSFHYRPGSPGIFYIFLIYFIFLVTTQVVEGSIISHCLMLRCLSSSQLIFCKYWPTTGTSSGDILTRSKRVTTVISLLSSRYCFSTKDNVSRNSVYLCFRYVPRNRLSPNDILI